MQIYKISNTGKTFRCKAAFIQIKMPEGDKVNNYKPTKKAGDVHKVQSTGTQAQKIQMSSSLPLGMMVARINR